MKDIGEKVVFFNIKTNLILVINMGIIVKAMDRLYALMTAFYN